MNTFNKIMFKFVEVLNYQVHNNTLRKCMLHCKNFSLFKKWAVPASFSFIFGLFQTNNTMFTTNQCEKISCPSSIRRRDSSPQPLEHESPPITTRPLVFSLI